MAVLQMRNIAGTSFMRKIYIFYARKYIPVNKGEMVILMKKMQVT